jgi:hypothetical protein
MAARINRRLKGLVPVASTLWFMPENFSTSHSLGGGRYVADEE